MALQADGDRQRLGAGKSGDPERAGDATAAQCEVETAKIAARARQYAETDALVREFLAVAGPILLSMRSNASRPSEPMCFLFQSGHNLVETVDIAGVDATDNGPFQCG